MKSAVVFPEFALRLAGIGSQGKKWEKFDGPKMIGCASSNPPEINLIFAEKKISTNFGLLKMPHCRFMPLGKTP